MNTKKVNTQQANKCIRKGFSFFHTFEQAFNVLPDAGKLDLLASMMAYGLHNEDRTPTDPTAAAFWELSIKGPLRKSCESWDRNGLNSRTGKSGNPTFQAGRTNPYYQAETPKENQNEPQPEKSNHAIKAKKRKHPTRREVNQFVDEEKLSDYVFADDFYDFYKSRGWKIGKDDIIDWRTMIYDWAYLEDKIRGSEEVNYADELLCLRIQRECGEETASDEWRKEHEEFIKEESPIEVLTDNDDAEVPLSF